jgi:hypothetical protein
MKQFIISILFLMIFNGLYGQTLSENNWILGKWTGKDKNNNEYNFIFNNMVHDYTYIMFFPYDFTHTFIILLLSAGASSGVLNRIGFANNESKEWKQWKSCGKTVFFSITIM